MWDVSAKAEKLDEDDIHDGKHEERFEDGPEVAEDGALVAELEVGFDELAEENAVATAEEVVDFHAPIIPLNATMDIMKELLKKHGQKIRFGLVGVANTLIDVVLFALFANLLGIVAEWASVMSTSVAIVFSFFANYYFVWRSKKSKARTIPQFLAVTLITAWGVQTAVIWLVKLVIGEGDWENLLAKACAIAVGMVVNYLLYKMIFTDKRGGKDKNVG